MNLFRVIHESSRGSPLAAYRAPGRYHLTSEEAEQTSYLSFSVATCIAEVSHHLGSMVKFRNRWSLEFEVTVERVVDLTTARELRRLKITKEDLTDDADCGIPQEVARRVRRMGIQALIVPSVRDPAGKNVVLFLENIPKKAIRKIREEQIE